MQYILYFLWQGVMLSKRGWSLVMRYCRYRTRLCRVSHALRPGHSLKALMMGRLHSSLREKNVIRAKLHSEAPRRKYWTYPKFESTLNYAKLHFKPWGNASTCKHFFYITNQCFLKAGFPYDLTNEFSFHFNFLLQSRLQ